MTIRIMDNKTCAVIYTVSHDGYCASNEYNRQTIIPRVGDTIYLPKFKNIKKIQYNNKAAIVRDVIYRYDDYTEDENPDTRHWNEHKRWFALETEFNLDVMCEITPIGKNKNSNYE